MEKTKQVGTAFWKFAGAFALMAACVVAAPSVALAYSPLQVALPVTVTVEGNVPDEPETFDVTLEALDEGAVMPAGAQGATCELQVAGGARATFPAMTFDAPCVWRYAVTQAAGTNELGTYDETRYIVTVSITNDENGQLAQTVAVHPEDSAEKLAEVAFANTYATPPSAVPQTGDALALAVIALACAACAACTVAVMAFRRSKVQRAGHRR